MYYIGTCRKVVTLTGHRCFGCSLGIPSGSSALLHVYMANGKFNRCFFCEVCFEYMATNEYSEDDLFSDGELKKNDPDGWELAREFVIGGDLSEK